MTLDMYSEKVAEASALIREFAKVDYFHYFARDPESALEEFIAMLDQAEEKGRQSQAARIAELERQIVEVQAECIKRGADLLERQLAEASAPAVGQQPVASDGWLIDGSLVYKLDPTGTMNLFEINVTQAEGSRKHDGPRIELAKRILEWLTTSATALGQQPMAYAIFATYEGTRRFCHAHSDRQSADAHVSYFPEERKAEVLPLYTAPQAADTDKVREAIKYSAGLRIAIENAASGYGEFIDAGLAETIGKEVVTFLNFTMAAQAPVREVPGWQPIETAPKDGSHVLCYAPELQFVGFYGDPINKWCYMAPGVPLAPTQPTHWAPLPAAPVQQDTDATKATGTAGELPPKQNLTLDNAPIGTMAPSINGGAWYRAERGWKWNNGSTFPRPGGDWNGELIAPTEAARQPAPVVVSDEQIFKIHDQINDADSQILAFARAIISAISRNQP